MKTSSILAHRGLFNSNAEKNSLTAIHRALQSGFGLETDVRDLDGSLVISHDPPSFKSSPMSLHALLEMINVLSTKPRIALNIKSDGLLNLLNSDLLLLELTKNIFLFDMSVPDAVQYFGSSLTTYGRISEYESLNLLPHISGFWIDNFNGNFPQVEAAISLLAGVLRVCLVSSELHRRTYLPLWKEILKAGICHHPSFEICTDHPLEALNFFS